MSVRTATFRAAPVTTCVRIRTCVERSTRRMLKTSDGSSYDRRRQMGRKKPIAVTNVGKSVSKPAWTVGDIFWLVCTAGLAWPVVWMRRRKRTMITRHR